MSQTILVIEDEEINTEIIQSCIEETGNSCKIVDNCTKALKLIESEKFPVIIVELNLADLNPERFVEFILRQSPESEIIVQTSDQSARSAISLLRLGVSDYILKPLNRGELKNKISNALKRAGEISSIGNQNENYLNIENSVSDAIFARWMGHLHTILNQGSGFGAMISLIKLMGSVAEQDGEILKLPASLLPALQQNARTGEKILITIQDIHKIQTNPLEMRDVVISELIELITGAIDNSSDALARHGHKIVFNKPDDDNERYLKINPAMISSSVEELILNAVRFSTEGSEMILRVKKEEDALEISLENDVADDHFSEIKNMKNPLESAFEPFSRLTVSVQEEYGAIESGLGLTRVRQIMIKHSGAATLIALFEAQRVQAILRLPLFNAA